MLGGWKSARYPKQLVV